jgi:Spy/CpxP family protein refolding chaperone
MIKRLLPVWSLLLVVAALSFGVSLLVVRLNRPPDVTDTHQFDVWLHRQLGITAEQEKRMATFEEAYHSHQREVIRDMQRLNGELAVAIAEDKGESERVRRISAEIHRAHGELQDASLRHVFEMKEHLTPAQYEKLISLTANALRPENRPEIRH